MSAIGAPIHASLQASITRTLTPAGVDQVGPIASTERTQVITGITVTRQADADGAANETTVLRMLSPTLAATARVSVNSAGRSETIGEPQEVSLEAGKPLELALNGLPPGAYTVTVEADAPVVAAVWQATGVSAGDDFAWYTPAPEVTVPSLFATPGGPTPSLTLVNPSGEPVTVDVTPTDGGSALNLTVPANGSVAVRLATRTLYLFDPQAAVRAGLSFAGDGALAGVPVWPADVATPEIVVYP